MARGSWQWWQAQVSKQASASHFTLTSSLGWLSITLSYPRAGGVLRSCSRTRADDSRSVKVVQVSFTCTECVSSSTEIERYGNCTTPFQSQGASGGGGRAAHGRSNQHSSTAQHPYLFLHQTKLVRETRKKERGKKKKKGTLCVCVCVWRLMD